MKKIIYTCLVIFTGIIITTSCEQNKEIFSFDTKASYLYFDMPKILDNVGKETSERADSLIYSFALDLKDITSYTFKIPVAVSGIAHSEDRAYTVEVVEEKTTASSADWDVASIKAPVFHKGKMFDSLLLTINRTSILKSEWKSIALKIKANESFMLGREDLITTKISFVDILQPPVWWESWKKVFGPFYLETYLKWKEIYYKGADPNKARRYMSVSKDPNEPFYWDNMYVGPYADNASYIPSTYVFIAILRNYFEKNIVYGTNANGSKTRIRIY